MRKRHLIEIIASKGREISAFCRHSRTPMALTLDTLRLKRSPFVAVSGDSIKLEIRPRAGESFTFYENLIRRDYLANGIKLRAGATVVDVGANIGAFTVLAASIVGPTGRVIAFEPISKTFERLEANVALNGLGNVEARRAAVDARDGTITIHLAEKSSLATAHGVNGYGEGTAGETVPCLTIARLFEEFAIDRIDLLKVDCEGSEYGIFRSLTPELAARIDQIAMEVHAVEGETDVELAGILRSLGFSVHPEGMNWVAFNESARRSG